MNDSQRSASGAGTTATDLSGEPPPNEKRTPPNTCTVIHDRGSEEMHLSRENVEKLLAGDSFFWLDIDQPDADDYKILSDVFKFHPLAVEDSEKFGQRAKIDDYDDYVFLVVYGAVPDRGADRGPRQAPLSDHRRTRRQLLPHPRRLR
jgi:CorA-like Mg2+ transporter protein